MGSWRRYWVPLGIGRWYKPPTGFCHKPYEVIAEPQSRAPQLFCTGSVTHSHKHTVELVKYSRKHVLQENKELELQVSLPCPEGSRMSPQDERLLLNDKMPGFLVSGGDDYNPGPETRLDRSELLWNKVLLKYKGDRESFWHRYQKGAERITPS